MVISNPEYQRFVILVSMVKPIFAENLRAKRESLGLSAEELAKRVHVSRSYITLLESGKRFPGKMLLLKIARALRLDKKVVITWYLNCHGRKLKELFGVKRE